MLQKNGRKFQIKATNSLLGDPEVSAVKTGFTNEAQGSMITKITHKGNSFIIIVIGSPNREADTIALKEEVINSYQWE